MAYQYLDYPSKARRLADAGAGLLEAISDPTIDRNIVIVDLEASTSGSSELRARFEPAAKTTVAAKAPEDTLSQILLELQSANTLLAAGIAMNEHGRGENAKFLNDAVGQIRSTSSEVGSHIAKSKSLQFAPQTKASETVQEAVTLFVDTASRTLESIANGTDSVIRSVFTKLKELDQSKVSEAIGTLGKSFQIVEAASRLIRRGLEKLKSVINALSDLFGSDAMADVKTKVQDVWKKFTNDNALVRNIIGLPAAQTRVRDFAQRAGQQLLTLDSLSRELALLEDKFQGKRNLLGGLEKAIVLAMSILAALQVFGLWAVAPWTVLAAAGAYAALIGAALLVGMNYTGSRRFVGWVRGVYEIAT